ncbi:MAG: sugar-binding domain-containing protein [Rubrivivax sp.]
MSKPPVNELRASQMRRAAELYYEQAMGQADVARMLGCSTATVSRLLAGAQEQGIVRIQIQRAGQRVPEVERALRARFGLREAVVVPGRGSSESDLRAVGQAAAEVLLGSIQPNVKIGITWGQTLAQMVQALYENGREPANLDGVEVLQLSGSLGEGDPSVDGPQLAMRLADCFGGVCRLVPAPALMHSTDLARALLEQPQIRAALARAAHPDIVVQGVGALDPALCSLTRAGYLSDDDRRQAQAAGAVGHLFARMVDAHGGEVGGFDSRVIAVPIAAIRRARISIGITASAAKVPAILAALRARVFNTLVVDEPSARQVLKLADAPDAADRSTRLALAESIA